MTWEGENRQGFREGVVAEVGRRLFKKTTVAAAEAAASISVVDGEPVMSADGGSAGILKTLPH